MRSIKIRLKNTQNNPKIYKKSENINVIQNSSTQILQANVSNNIYKVEWSLNLTNLVPGNHPTLINIITDSEEVEDCFIDLNGSSQYEVKTGWTILNINNTISVNVLCEFSDVHIRKAELILTEHKINL